jgi:sulfate permease, SulP family
VNTGQSQSNPLFAHPISRSPDLPIPRLTRLDVAGAFGDVGVLFPIAIALITLNHLNPTALFLTAGLTYCFAARYFQIPIAVQPFKAVAAIALALALSPSEVASAGLLMGVLLLALRDSRRFPAALVLLTLWIILGVALP